MTPGPRSTDAPDDGTAITGDALLGGRVSLRQPARGYRAAIDPVLLAAAVPARAGDRVADLGCGVGAAALCLLARVPDIEVTGLELQGDLVRLAGENAALNGRSGRFHVHEGDILKPPAALAVGRFDQVMINPPYLSAAGGRPPETSGAAAATREGEARLDDWIAAALDLLRPKGRVTIIHRADRLDDLLSALKGRAGEIRVCPLWPTAGRAAKRVIVGARRSVAAPVALAPGLVLHRADGGFTTQAEAILRDAEALVL